MSDLIQTLEQQMAAIQEQLKREKGKEDARAKVADLLTKLGYSFDELYGPEKSTAAASGGRVKKKRAKPMYQNPENKKQSWSGPEASPNKPQWVVEYEAAGGNIEDCRIKGA